uniref:Uncharacterized protein n=1 Tax=Nicotiana tabacum TaxID=4097 RepID=A0A1S3Y6A7_TOBAC|nr:PREDICTED: uncharacterized protein LOC107772741 [Nicotiana tabacum]
MVVALGPGKFYGSSLPRPRFYSNPNGEQRVDPPVSVLDPLMSWAEEAHWSMGGLSFKRLRLQGRIEGNIKKLKAEREKFEKKAQKKSPVKVCLSSSSSVSPSPPPAPLNLKRKMRLVDESEDENEEEIEKRVEKRGPARKLDADFDRVSVSGLVKGRTRSGRNREAVVEVVNKGKVKGKRLKKGLKSGLVTPASVTRTSPRLSNHGSR